MFRKDSNMMKSLYSGVSGMKTHTQRMDVIGNNIANVNTTGYKTSTVTFKDVYYQTKAGASAGDATSGGSNPTQVGYGSSLATINQVMTQSGFTYSDSNYDCAIQGEGFFQVIDEAGNIFYTRAGVFSVDSYGNLCDANGYIVLGVSGDPTGTEASSQRINLNVPSVDNNVASATKTVNGYEVTISAAGYGEDGNISFTIVDSDSPYANLSGTNLTVYMDLSAEFEDVDQFTEAFNAAISAGGVDLDENVLPINFEFDAIPTDILATSASNTLTLTAPETGEASGLVFTAETPGEYANAYEINMKTSAAATEVRAKWNNGVLTITLPKGTEEDPANYTIEDIQAAIDEAADENEKLSIIVSESDDDAFDPEIINAALEDTTARVSLAKGTDNFFSDVAQSLSTVNLVDGRFAAEQGVDDLETVVIDSDGTIYGFHPVHGTIALGRIDIVTFENPIGLEQVGTSLWRKSLASGEPEVKIAGQDGAGEIVSGALEMSNVDLSQEFSDMIITQRGFQANSRIITVSDTMLEELVNLKR